LTTAEQAAVVHVPQAPGVPTRRIAPGHGLAIEPNLVCDADRLPVRVVVTAPEPAGNLEAPNVFALAARAERFGEVLHGLDGGGVRSEQVDAPHRVAVDVVRVGVDRSAIVLHRVEASRSLARAQKVTPAFVRQTIGRPSSVSRDGASGQHWL